MTFLDMLNEEDKTMFARPNEYLPSKSLGKCEMCPAWQFSSVIEAKRHIFLLHPSYRKESLPGNDQTYQCKFDKCNMIFPTYYKLSKHRKEENHFVRNKRPGEKSLESDQQIDAKRKKTEGKISGFFSQKRSEVVDSDNDSDGMDVEVQNDEPMEDAHDDVSNYSDDQLDALDMESLEEVNDFEMGELHLTLGEYVGAVYENKPFIGRISDIDGDDVEIDFMKPEVKPNINQTFLWPDRPDKIWRKREEILGVISSPREVKRGYQFSEGICQNILDLFSRR